MQHWLTPAAVALVCWGIWAFLPKITTRYIDPASALVFEAGGGVIVALVVLISIGFKLNFDWRGFALALTTGMLGVLGALSYLYAVTRGPVALIATVTALYPALTIVLAFVVLQESINLRQAIGILLGLVALILITGGDQAPTGGTG